MKGGVHCSFCQRPLKNVFLMVANSAPGKDATAWICNYCVDLSAEAIERERGKIYRMNVEQGESPERDRPKNAGNRSRHNQAE